MKNEDDEILAQAAAAARAKLPALEAERQELSEKLQKLAIKITQYQNIAAAVPDEFSDDVDPVDLVPGRKTTKGRCMADIDAVLTSQGVTVKEIQAAIRRNAGLEYGVSTLYANLQRGLGLGKYVNENGRWAKNEL